MKKLILGLISVLILLTFAGCSDSQETSNSNDSFYSNVVESEDEVMINNFSSSGFDVEWLGAVYGYDYPSDGLFISLYSNFPVIREIELDNGEGWYVSRPYEIGETYDEHVVTKYEEHEGILIRDAIQGTAADGKHYHDGKLFTGVCENTYMYYENGIKINKFYKSTHTDVVLDTASYYQYEEDFSNEYEYYEGDVYAYTDDLITQYSTNPNKTFYIYEITTDDYTYTTFDSSEYEVGQDYYGEGTITAYLGTITECTKVQ